ncbi:hypothetical protein [Psychrobacter fjordensis]|uniref:hypothetical protein n=1 Tax=Psychrobacter fjordensis TaxID=664424 RepID=UPI00191B36B4|nr:hypothetical protein [Psychrobacter fjordensis]
MELNNPIERLIVFLKNAKKISINTSSVKAWDELLDTEGDIPLRMERIAKFHRLIEEVCLELSNLENYEDVTQPIIKNLKILHEVNNLNSTWGSIVNVIKDTTITGLEIFVKFVGDRYTSDYDLEKLFSIKKELSAILEQTLESQEIEPELKKFLIRSLRNIITSIEEYHIAGILPVSDALNTSLGRLLTDEQYRELLNQNTLGKKISLIFAELANITTVLTSTAPLVGVSFKLLTNI